MTNLDEYMGSTFMLRINGEKSTDTPSYMTISLKGVEHYTEDAQEISSIRQLLERVVDIITDKEA